MALIDYIDGPNRRIHLSASTMNYAFQPAELYREIRHLRKTDETLRGYDNFMMGTGNIDRGSGRTTEKYFTLLNGARIVPYNASHVVDVTGILITDSKLEGVYCFDRTGLSDGVQVTIQYTPTNVEIVEYLVYGSFQGSVWVNVTSGQSTRGTDTKPNGNTERPVNNIQLAVQIAKDRGFDTIQVVGALTLTDGDDVRGMNLIGTSHINSVLTVEPAALCENTRFSSFNITGTLDGGSEIKDCIVRNLEYFNGYILDSALAGTITLGGDMDAMMDNCKMLNILDTPVIDCGDSGQNLIMTAWSGGLKVTNITGASSIGIGCDAGDIVIDPSCTAGNIALSGTGAAHNYSSKGCYVIDKLVDGSELQNLHLAIEHLRPHHTGTGVVIYWDPYSGNDMYHGDHPDRAVKTFVQAHNLAKNANHDTIMIVPGDPSGTTIITEPIYVTKDYLFVRGPGRDVIVRVEDSEDALRTEAKGTEFSGFRVQHSVENGHGMHSVGAFTMISDVWFEQCTNGVLFTKDHPIVQNCKFYNPDGFAIRMEGEVLAGEIENVQIGRASGNGIEIDTDEGWGGIQMRDTSVVGSAGYGVTLSETTTVFVANSGNTLGSNTLGDWLDEGSHNVTTGAIDPIEMHNILDTYTNKTGYMADISNLSADVNVIEVAGVAVTSIDDFKESAEADIQPVLDAIGKVTTQITDSTESINEHTTASTTTLATAASINDSMVVINDIKSLITEIDVGMDALDASNVNSIYERLMELKSDISAVKSAGTYKSYD